MPASWRSAAAALARIPDGAHLVALPGMGAPTTLLAALASACAGHGWTLGSGIQLDDYPFLSAVDAGELAYRTWHPAGPAVERVAAGTVTYVPARASAVPAMLRRDGVGAALVRVGPPDARGLCSLGGSTGYARAAVEAASVVIAEVDPDLPRTCGDAAVPVALFDSLVESAAPAPQYRAAPDTDLGRRIAAHVLGLIPQDPVLQIGLGAVSEALLRSLPVAELGRVRFVGMGTEEMVDLIASGAVRPGDGAPALLSADLMGTARLLRFAHENPAIQMASSAVVHDAASLGRLDRFVSINTALEVDLAGNVNCEVLRGRQISGPGGGPDFADAAARSAGGLAVVALPAASTDGAVPRIVRAVGRVTIEGATVDVVVTEHGVADLRRLTDRQRADALVAVAHPAHRDALADQPGLAATRSGA